ncbi:hypothetical protein MCAMS1_02037 [biofilm metagenome]
MNKLMNCQDEKANVKRQRTTTEFRREIRFALALKLVLLFMLWWFFFADKKQPVNPEILADKLLGLEKTALTASQHKEKF